MKRMLRRAVDSKDYLVDEETLAAYSYDGSEYEQKPQLVLRPRNEEQLRRILLLANQYRFPVVPRGAGTGIRGGTVKEGGVIIDLRGFNKIWVINHSKGYVDVGVGVSIGELNKRLKKEHLWFPLVPENSQATMGGLASQNHLTAESMKYGEYTDVVLDAEGFDGLGRFHKLKGEELNKAIGTEGTLTIMTKLRLKIFKRSHYTMEIHEVKGLETIGVAEEVTGENTALLEYFDSKSSELVGLGEGEHVVVVYDDDTGSYKDTTEFLKKRRTLEKEIWKKKLFLENATLTTTEQVIGFINLCKKKGAICFGHIGIGLFTAGIPKSDNSFCTNIVALGGTPNGKHGYGRVRKEYVPISLKKRILKLKDERDYRGILNPGVLV